MNYAIVGFGAIGQALARMFARKGIEVAVASRHPPEALAPLANAIGPTIVPNHMMAACHQTRYQRVSNGTRRACNENAHDITSRVITYSSVG